MGGGGGYSDSEINFLNNSDYDEDEEKENDLVIVYFKKYRKDLNYSRMSKNEIASLVKNFKPFTSTD